MIPDLPPSQETMEESLARLAEINDSATMDPKDMQNLKLFKIQSAKAEEGKENNNYSHEILDYPTGFDLAFDEREKNPFLHERKRLPSKSNARPLLSYIDMIKGALKTSADGKMKLVDIYRWIEEEYPFYKSCGLSWKNSVRHALSVSKIFRRVTDKPHWCRGGEWALTEDEMAKEHADYSNFKNVSVPVGKENRVDATKAILKEQYETIQPKFRYRYLQESLPSQFQSFEREPSPLESTEDFDEIFSGTRTPLDPFCSVQENPPKVENGQIIDYFDDGNILDLVVDADGMIKSKYHVKNSQHKFIFNN